jgi:prepilin-type N-terminal cleavage/methylation domain-containing protein
MGLYGIKMKNEKGYTLVELMVAIAIFGLILAIVFELFYKVNYGIVVFRSRNEMLNQQLYIQRALSPYVFGTVHIFDVDNIEKGPLYNWTKQAVLNRFEFSALTKENGVAKGHWIYVENKVFPDTYIKTEDGSCVPRTYVVIYIRDGGVDIVDTVPSLDDWQKWIADGTAREYKYFPKGTVSNEYGYSSLTLLYGIHSIEADNFLYKWNLSFLVFTVGVADKIYGDSACTTVIRNFPFNLRPYSIILPMSFDNMLR